MLCWLIRHQNGCFCDRKSVSLKFVVDLCVSKTLLMVDLSHYKTLLTVVFRNEEAVIFMCLKL